MLFGHHFAAITGAGPLIGPVLACQYGYAPGFIWLLSGVVLAGAVHDLVALTGSIRHGGRSLAELVRGEISPISGGLASIAILGVLVLAVAAMGFAVVNSMKQDAWGAFTLAASIPLAMGMGLWIRRGGPGAVAQATVIGVLGLLLAVGLGGAVAGLPADSQLKLAFNTVFALSPKGVAIAVAVYGFLGSVLPVWLLLAPRDYLSTYMKLGTILILVAGVLIVHPTLEAPAVSKFVSGGGPVVAGKLFPFMFITIACGAISGFHSLIATGTTSKMLARESDARPIGYGAMLCEGLVGITCLVAASALHPADYFAINSTAEVFQHLGLTPIDLPSLEQDVGVKLAAKTGGAVSLAVGMAKIFTGLPLIRAIPRALAYWYHFAIMFEALFILTTVDAGTRVARFLIQEMVGRANPKLGRPGFLVGALVTTLAVVVAWTWLIFAALENPRGMGILWTMLGVSNQLLAVIALSFGTVWLVNQGKARYAWVTLVPLVWVATTTLTGGFLSVTQTYWRMAQEPATRAMGLVCAGSITAVMACALAVVFEGARRCLRVLSAGGPPSLAEGVEEASQ